MQNKTIVTTSWDDGNRSDLKVAECLRSRGVQGTFYYPITPYRGPNLTHQELRSISSEGFEIGAHGFSHKLLWKLPAEELSREVGPCKPALEDILGKEIRMFCYPQGRGYDSNVIRVLQEAGYCGARTVRMLATRLEFNPFEMPTTVQVFPHPKSVYLKNIAKAGKVEGLQNYLASRGSLDNWLDLSKALFDSVLQNGGIWHVYGHSDEINDLGLWEDLERLLDYVCKREGVMYVTNSELLQFLPTTSQRCREGQVS